MKQNYQLYYKQNKLLQLKGFVTLIQEKTLPKTAEKLKMSNSAILTQIKSLESQLQTQLFVKEGKYLQPTHQALKLYDKTQPLITSIENIYKDFDEKQNLDIAGDCISLINVAHIIHNSNKHNIQININELQINQSITKLKIGEIDIAFHLLSEDEINSIKKDTIIHKIPNLNKSQNKYINSNNKINNNHHTLITTQSYSVQQAMTHQQIPSRYHNNTTKDYYLLTSKHITPNKNTELFIKNVSYILTMSQNHSY